MAEYRCLTNYPSNSTTSGPRTNGVEFYVTADTWLTTIWAWRPTTSVTMPASAALYRVSTGAELVTATRDPAVASTATGWIPFRVATPYKLTPNVRYRAGALFPGTSSPGTSGYWSSTGGGGNGLVSGPLVMPSAANATNQRQGTYNASSTRGFPNTASTSNAIYGIDVTVSDVDPAAPPPEPTWAPNPALTGTARWVADTTQPDAPAAGYASSGSQRQNAAGQFNDPTVPWPPPYYPAPFGRDGARALMLRVPDNYRRYEVNPHPAITFGDGEEAWFGVALAVGADTDTDQSDYQVLWQIHGSGPGGSPSLAIEASGGRWRLTGGANRPNPQTLAYDTGGTYAYVRNLTDTIVRERWYHFVIYVGFWSAINSGRIDVWCDGARVLENFRPPCGTNYPPIDANDSGRAYAKTGLYHRESIRGGTTWVAEQTLATGYGAADPARAVRDYQGVDLAAI